jgi:ubiquitin
MCNVLKMADEQGVVPNEAAVRYAEGRVEEIGTLRMFRRRAKYRT